MSELGDVLELLHSSPSLWHTMQAAGTEWTDPSLFHEAFRRGFDRHSVMFTSISRDDSGVYDDDDATERWRLWIEQPDRRRVEFLVGQQTVTAVWLGDTWWSWSPSQGAMTNNGQTNHSHGKGPSEAIIETPALLGALTFEVLGRAQLLDREVLKAIATPRLLPMPSMALHGLGSGADDYVLSVDAERGVVLRSEARLRGKPFKVIEITEIDFDPPLPAATFAPPTPQAL